MSIATRTIAAFDFDGTITTKDTLFDFVKFCVGNPRFFIGIIIISPILILFKLKLIKNSLAKQLMFAFYFKSMPIEKFNNFGLAYVKRINEIINPEAMDKIKWHQQQGHEVVIVSASIENWITPWANTQGIKTVLSTKIDSTDGKLSGKFASINCHGQEKVNRLLQYLDNNISMELYAYGDSNGDKELLALANHPFYRKFK